MGGRKPLRRWGGSTLIAHAVSQARRYAPLVAVAVRSPDQLERGPNAPQLLDDPSIPGPLAGVAAGLAFAGAQHLDAVLTLPCDMPLLPEELAARLAEALDRGDAQVSVAQSRGRLHPVCALWRVSITDRLPDYASRGRVSLKGLAAEAGFAVADWGDVEPDPFTGANTSEELAALERLVASGRD